MKRGILLSSGGDRFAEGQVWQYETRPEDTGSLLKIMKIEDVPGVGRIFHTCVVGLRIEFAPAESGYLDEIPSLPLTEDVLNRSVSKLSEIDAECTRFELGYSIWRQDFENGMRGIVTIPVRRIVERYAERARELSLKGQ